MNRRAKTCLPERIVVCVDCSEDGPRLGRVNNNNPRGKQLSAGATAKKCAEVFLLNKAGVNPHHQFALLIMKRNGVYMSGFQNKVDDHIRHLNTAATTTPQSSHQPVLSDVFGRIYDNVYRDEEGSEDAPLHVVIFYSRSGTCVMEENLLSDCKNVTVDILFIHKPVLSSQEQSNIESTVTELKSCLMGKSMFKIGVAGSLLCLKYTMYFLIHPNLRE